MITSATKNKSVPLLLLCAGLVTLLYWPVLRWLVNVWLSSDYYSYGFLVPPVAAFFVLTKRAELKAHHPSFIGVWLLGLGLLAYAFSFITGLRVIGALSLLCSVWGIVLTVFGVQAARTLLFPLGFLVFMVPLPFIPDLSYRLQAMSVTSSSWILRTLGLPISVSGAQIGLPNNVTFTIGLVCSGVDSLLALTALGAVYAYILKGPIVRRSVLWTLSFPLAMAGNILRITSIIAVAYFVSPAIAAGWYHDLSSPLFFMVAFLALAFTGRAMKCRINYDLFGRVLPPRQRAGQEKAEDRRGPSTTGGDK